MKRNYHDYWLLIEEGKIEIEGFTYTLDDLVDMFDNFPAYVSYWCDLIGYTNPITKVDVIHHFKRKGKTHYYCSELFIHYLWSTYPSDDGVEFLEENEETPKRLYWDTLIKAIGRAIREEYWNGDLTDADAEVVDVIIQLALFDDVVYG